MKKSTTTADVKKSILDIDNLQFISWLENRAKIDIDQELWNKMKQVKAIPKLVFDKNFTDKEFKYYDYACFISILDIDNNEQKFDKSIDNFLQVKMWDIEEDLFENGELKYEKPNDNELKNIVDFINKHKDKSVFIIHCSAGISRSGAVATFLYDKFLSEIDKEQFRRENKYIRPNLYILNRLKSLDTVVLE